mgnify:CR=1 FL=1
MRITDTTLVNTLLAVQDCVLQTWLMVLVPPFIAFSAGNFGKVYLGNIYTDNIKGLHIVQVAMGNSQELTRDQARFVLGIKQSLLFVGQLDL